jgi:H/ACA ribonucleoprotein complex subunit 1
MNKTPQTWHQLGCEGPAGGTDGGRVAEGRRAGGRAGGMTYGFRRLRTHHSCARKKGQQGHGGGRGGRGRGGGGGGRGRETAFESFCVFYF